MNICPSCGYDPNPPILKLTDAELRHQRVLNTFYKNLSNSWWISQPEYICSKLKEQCIDPKSILDVGCGDGRWLPGILKTWPMVEYIGIDSILEHIEDNKEKMPSFQWFHMDVDDYLSSKPTSISDLVILGGTLQERGKQVPIYPILNPILKLNPEWVIILLDCNVTWDFKSFSLDGYSHISSFTIPPEFQAPDQDNIVYVFQETEEIPNGKNCNGRLAVSGRTESANSL